MNAILSPRLLIADPCPDNRGSLALLARNDGCEVQTAASPAETLLLNRIMLPDVVLVEVMWEKLRPIIGYDLIAGIRCVGDAPEIIVVTGYQTDEHLDRCRRLGVPHVLKPYDRRQLLALVRERAAVRRQLARPFVDQAVQFA